MNKDISIKYMRIVATVMVLIGHAIIIFDPSWGVYETTNTSFLLYSLKQYINIYQMPIFFVISGYLFKLTFHKYQNLKELFIEKFKRLIIPFIFIAFFWLLPIRILIKYPIYFVSGKFDFLILIKILFGIEVGHLWFLYALFIMFCMLYVVVKYNKEKLFLVISLFLSIIFSYLPVISFSSNLFQFLFYFVFGYVMFEKLISISKTYYKFICIILSMLISTISIFMLDIAWLDNVISIMANILFIYFLYHIFQTKKDNSLINRIDRDSLGIYLFHMPIMYIFFSFIPNINPYLLVSINIVVGLVASLIMIYLLRKVKLGFLIGEKNIITRRKQ